jgi:hypothetical protein
MTQDSGARGGVSQLVNLAPPNGLAQILATFGNIYEYIRPDGGLDSRWRTDVLCRVIMPFELPISWDRARTVSSMTCHRKLAGIFASVFAQIQAGGLQSSITSFGGCFAFRRQRAGSKLSTHSWGIALDLNPETNAQGTSGTMDAELIEVFCGAGFKWGGDWGGSRRDPMHFQFCTGY